MSQVKILKLKSDTFDSRYHRKVITTKTNNYTITSDDMVVLCNATSADITITLPNSSSASGYIFYIKRIDSSPNTVTVDGNGSQTIDGQTTQTLNQYDSIQIVSDGTNWSII